VLDRRISVVALAEDERRAADRVVGAVQRRDDRADEGRLSGAQPAAQRDDVARAQRAGELARERFESIPSVEDDLARAQNSVRCSCA
jgi:uncharacterized membrane protein